MYFYSLKSLFIKVKQMFRLKIIYKEVKLEFKMFVTIFLIGTVIILKVRYNSQRYHEKLCLIRV